MGLPILFRDAWLPGVSRRQLQFEVGLRDWLKECQWDPEAGMTSKKVVLSIHKTDAFVDACVLDSISLAIAAFESASAREMKPQDQRSCAWQFIRYYYSAYFAANALMRISGYGLTNLASSECTAVNEHAYLYGVGGRDDKSKIFPGAFAVRYIASKTPALTLRTSNGKGGVHMQFWVAFLDFLNCLETDIKKGTSPLSDRKQAIAELDALKTELKNSNNQNGAWLSELRNAVNYRFELGLWFPYDNCSVDVETLRVAFIKGAKGETSIVGMNPTLPEILRASRSCSFLLNWLHQSMSTIAATSKGRKHALISNGVLSFAAKL